MLAGCWVAKACLQRPCAWVNAGVLITDAAGQHLCLLLSAGRLPQCLPDNACHAVTLCMLSRCAPCAVTTAMMGLCLLLSTGVLHWRECLTYPAAWDTLFW